MVPASHEPQVVQGHTELQHLDSPPVHQGSAAPSTIDAGSNRPPSLPVDSSSLEDMRMEEQEERGNDGDTEGSSRPSRPIVVDIRVRESSRITPK